MTPYSSKPPSVWPLLLKAGLKGRASKESVDFNVKIDQQESRYAFLDHPSINAYHKVVNWVHDSHISVHPCYYHLLVFPQHLRLMLDKRFPFPLLGLVHLSNRIEQSRSIKANESLLVQSHLTKINPHPKGYVAEIESNISVSDRVIWCSVSEFLYRTPQSNAFNEKQIENPSPEDSDLLPSPDRWQIKANIGRRYARVSGDYNLIHWSATSAKWFGFKRAIAHGMWSKAACLSAMAPLVKGPFTCRVEFVKPLYIPSTTDFHNITLPTSSHFTLSSDERRFLHLAGHLEF